MNEYDITKQIATTFVNDVMQRKMYVQSKDSVPTIYNDQIQEAIDHKRKGRYSESLKLYLDIVSQSNYIYTGLTLNMYKPVMCSGNLECAALILCISFTGIGAYVNTMFGQIPTEQSLHFKDLANAVTQYIYQNNVTVLKDYLTRLSGNNNYVIPISNQELLIEANKASKIIKTFFKIDDI